jgi:hypothetical protein
MEYAVSRRGYMVAAELAGIYFAIGYPVMSSYLLALYAEYALRITCFQKELQTSVIIGELLVKLFYGVFCGFHFALLTTNYNRSITQNVRVVKG